MSTLEDTQIDEAPVFELEPTDPWICELAKPSQGEEPCQNVAHWIASWYCTCVALGCDDHKAKYDADLLANSKSGFIRISCGEHGQVHCMVSDVVTWSPLPR